MSLGLDARKLSAPKAESLHIKRNKAGGEKKKCGGRLGGEAYLAHGALGMPVPGKGILKLGWWWWSQSSILLESLSRQQETFTFSSLCLLFFPFFTSSHCGLSSDRVMSPQSYSAHSQANLPLTPTSSAKKVMVASCQTFHHLLCCCLCHHWFRHHSPCFPASSPVQSTTLRCTYGWTSQMSWCAVQRPFFFSCRCLISYK